MTSPNNVDNCADLCEAIIDSFQLETMAHTVASIGLALNTHSRIMSINAVADMPAAPNIDDEREGVDVADAPPVKFCSKI